mgnify:CR=1 FL=1
MTEPRKWTVHTFPDHAYTPGTGTRVGLHDHYVDASDHSCLVEGPASVTAADPRRLTCLDDRGKYENEHPDEYVTGVSHSWESAGLDIVNGELRSVKVCVWCKRTRTSAVKP